MFSVSESDADAGVDLPQVIDNREELRKLQLQDTDLVCFLEYLECGSLPTNKSIAQKVILASKHYEMISGVLHYEDPSPPG